MHSVIRRYCRFVTFAVCLILSFAEADVGRLERGTPVVRGLSGNEEHSYQVSIPEGQYARVTVEQRGIDVVIQLLGSGGEVISTIDDEYADRGTETLEIAAAGDHQLRVKASSMSAPAAQYEIAISELRAGTERDRLLFEARKLQEGWRQAQRDGKYSEALRNAEQALAIAEPILGSEDPFVASLLFNLADYYEDRQDLSKSISLHERALSISEKTKGPESPLTVDISRSLAFVYWQANESTKAEETAQRAFDISEKTLGPEHHLVARCLQTLGMATRDDKKSEQLLNRALSIAEKTTGPDSILAGTILNDLGIQYLDRGDFAGAEQFLIRARAIKEKAVGPDNLTHSVSLLNLGMIARQKKDYTSAEEDYLKGVAIIEKAFGPDNPRLAMLLNNLANIYRARGEYDRSLKAHLQVLRISEATRGPFHPLTLTSLGNIAKTYAAQNDMENALRYQARVDTVIERNIEMNLAIGSERQKLSYLASMAERTDRTISLNTALSPDSTAASALAVLTVLQRKGRVLDAMSESFASLRQRSAPEQRAVLEQFNDVTTKLAKLVLNGPQRLTFSEHQQAINDLEGRKEQLESEISRQSAEFRSLSQTVTLASVQAALPSNAALIEFAVYRPFDPKAESNSEAYKAPRYIAYVVRPKGDVLWRDLGETKTIDESIDALRNALRDPKRSVLQVARAVDEQILKPLRPLLSDATHLLVSPDGAINFLPLEALVDEQNRYEVERYTITYLTSGRDLLRLQVARQSQTPALVLANPAYGDPSTQNSAANSLRGDSSATTSSDLATLYFSPLAGSAREAEAIGNLFPEATFLTGAQATESALKRLSAPRILHIATHGFFLGETPTANNVEGTRSVQANAKIENPLLRAGLALAGANLHKSTDEDGILTALEASGLNLWGTKLVTLSACDTGVGEVKSGEGVYGLRRAFVLAGTETLVMSLWPVSDYITRELMASYYTGLKQGLGRREALRRVQLKMLQRKGREHPFYWAAFVQSGEWANLDGQR